MLGLLRHRWHRHFRRHAQRHAHRRPSLGVPGADCHPDLHPRALRSGQLYHPGWRGDELLLAYLLVSLRQLAFILLMPGLPSNFPPLQLLDTRHVELSEDGAIAEASEHTSIW